MKKYFLINYTKFNINSLIVIFLFFTIFLSCNKQKITNNINYTVVNEKAIEESLNPIRPGCPPSNIPFWNKFSKQFLYAPAFDVSYMIKDKAIKYKFVATGSDNLEYTFTSKHSYDALSPIWVKLPIGFVSLKIYGLDRLDNIVEESNCINFYKSAPFHGPYHTRVSDYGESAKKALEYVFHQSHIQNWLSDCTPDTIAYELYCYPSKIIGAVIESMLEYSKISSINHHSALKIAKNAAKYLINISEPQGSPLEFFPPTYLGRKRTAKLYHDQFMTIYPAHTALIYLDLFDITEDYFYKDAALKIAATYKKLQESSGTWKLKLWADGSPVVDNDCIPLEIIKLFDRLEFQYNIKEYSKARDRAYTWIINNPLRTYNWSAQFEDIEPVEPYKNLSKDEAAAFATYLFEKRDNQHEKFIQIADELLRFCEDQFIIWENPMPRSNYNVNEWITPCVLEQYYCYEPISASAGIMMDSYLAGYKATKNKMYWVKMIELANTVTVTQHQDTGRYPTYWQLNERQKEDAGWIDWLNCTSYCVKVMLKISDFIKTNK